jgi:hypothetical protein
LGARRHLPSPPSGGRASTPGGTTACSRSRRTTA